MCICEQFTIHVSEGFCWLLFCHKSEWLDYKLFAHPPPLHHPLPQKKRRSTSSASFVAFLFVPMWRRNRFDGFSAASATTTKIYCNYWLAHCAWPFLPLHKEVLRPSLLSSFAATQRSNKRKQSIVKPSIYNGMQCSYDLRWSHAWLGRSVLSFCKFCYVQLLLCIYQKQKKNKK